MATVLRVENYAASSYVDFMGTEVKAARGHGTFRIDPNDKQTTTVFRLYIGGSDAADVRGNYNSLVALLDQGRKWHRDDIESDSVWLRWATNGETVKRSLIYDYSIINDSGPAMDPFQWLNTKLMVDLAITHDAEAEDVTAVTSEATYGGGSDGYDFFSLYTGAVAETTTGDRGARIGVFTFPPTATHSIDKIWVGLKPVSSYAGSLNVNLVWNAEDATAFGTGTALATEAGSYGTQVLDVDFTTGGGSNALAPRIGYYLVDFVTGDTRNMIGGYQVLLRYKLEPSTDVAIRAGISETQSSYLQAAYNSFQYDLDDDDNWHWLELGYMRFPPGGKRAAKVESMGTAINLDQLSIWIQAERISGTGSLFLDCIQLIPYEHFISVDELYQASAGDQYHYINTNENNTTVSFVRIVDDSINAVGSISSINDWRVPENTALFILAYAIEENGAAGTPGVNDATITMPKVYRRWAGYNGD